MKIAISSGHGKYVRGAAGPSPWGLDEVNEARRVVPALAEFLTQNGNEVVTFNEDVATTQSQNLTNIVNWHNKQWGGKYDLSVSVHFNAYVVTDGGRGVETLYLTQDKLAAKISDGIASVSGLINRGIKKRSDLYFLNGTLQPAVLLEICFVDAAQDVEDYNEHFDDICESIALAIAPVGAAAEDQLYTVGKVSEFGGPQDTGVTPSEGLAFIYDYKTKPEIFLPQQPPGTTGLARRLDPSKRYLALRWDYSRFSKTRLAGKEMALVRATKTGRQFTAHPADWGPHTSTGRVADISPGLMSDLGITTDDTVEVLYPYVGEVA